MNSTATLNQPLAVVMNSSRHVYEIRPRKDHRGVNLISDALPFGRLWYGETKRNRQRNRIRQIGGTSDGGHSNRDGIRLRSNCKFPTLQLMRGLRIHVASNPRMDIHFNCPRCGQKLSVEGIGVGLIVNCPGCEAEIEIPPGTAPQPNVSVPTIPQTLPHQRPSQSELDNVSRGSIVKVSDPDKHVCYWVIIERRLKNHHFFGRIDAWCMMGPHLRHGGWLTFHRDHISYIWPKKVDQVFDSAWFRHLSHVLSFRTGAKVLKRPPTSGPVPYERRLTDRIK